MNSHRRESSSSNLSSRLSYPSGLTSGESAGLCSPPAMEGYDYEFIPPVESRYECPVCLLVLREPRQTKCGHRFCKDCILRCIRESGARCPVDNEPLTEEEIFPDNFAKREILNFKIKCPNGKNGSCDAKILLGELGIHQQECPSALVPCPNKCSSILPRCQLENHINESCLYRQVTCPDCTLTFYATELQTHSGVCPNTVITCKNCGNKILRAAMGLHDEQECENITIVCPFSPFGCNKMMPRKEENEHLVSEAAFHLKSICSAVVSLAQRQSLITTVAGIPDQRSFCDTSQAQELSPHTEDATSWSNIVQALNAGGTIVQLNNGQIGTSGQAIRAIDSQMKAMRLEEERRGEEASDIYANCTDSQVSSSVCRSRSTSSPSVSRSLPGSRNVSPLGFSGMYSSKHRSISPRSHYRNSCFRQNTSDSQRTGSTNQPFSERQISSSSADSHSNHSFYMKLYQDSKKKHEEMLEKQDKEIKDLKSKLDKANRSTSILATKVKELNDALVETSAKTVNGMFYWKIPGYLEYQIRATSGETTVLHSSPFYSSLYGYKLCLRANINGIISTQGGRHLSLFVHFMQGDNDDILQWPFNGKIVFSIIDQNVDFSLKRHYSETLESKPNLAAFQKPTSPRNHKGFGYTEFISLNDLAGGTYILNDTLIIRAQVSHF